MIKHAGIGRLPADNMPQEMAPHQIRHHGQLGLLRAGETGGLPFAVQMERELMKRQDMHVEQGKLLLDAQKLFQSVFERIGRNDDGKGGKLIGGFKRPDFFGKCCFEIRMVAPCDDPEQRKPLRCPRGCSKWHSTRPQGARTPERTLLGT